MAERNAETRQLRFHPEWVPCVGCGVQIRLVNDPADTPEPHRSQCLGMRLPPGQGQS